MHHANYGSMYIPSLSFSNTYNCEGSILLIFLMYVLYFIYSASVTVCFLLCSSIRRRLLMPCYVKDLDNVDWAITFLNSSGIRINDLLQLFLFHNIESTISSCNFGQHE